MTTAAPVVVTLGVTNVAVEAEEAWITAAFADLYRDALGADPDVETIRLVVRRRRTLTGVVYDIVGDGELLTKGCRRDEVIPHLEWGINRRLVATCDDAFVIHAASMACGEQGVALVAPSGSGKSTLALALLARGWQYLCDEFAILDIRSGWLRPFPKAICLKAGSFECADALGVHTAGGPRYVKACKGKVAYVRPGDVQADAVASSVPLRAIVFPTFVACDDPRAIPLSSARAAFHLAANTMNPDEVGPRLVPELARLCAATPAFTLESGALDRTCDVLAERMATMACRAVPLAA